MKRWLLAIMLAWQIVAATTSEAAQVAWDQRLGAQLPLDAPMRDESGRGVRFGDYFNGMPAILVFAYFSCPQLCPQVQVGVGEAVRTAGLKAGRDVRIIVVSIDPHDRPEQAMQQRQHAFQALPAEAVAHLTADATTIGTLTRSAGFRYDAQETQFAHPAGFLVADPRGIVSRYFFGVRYPPDELRRAIEDARGSRIGKLTDHLLMLCSAFDPTQGRYSSLVMFAVRLVALACLIAALVFWLSQARVRGAR